MKRLLMGAAIFSVMSAAYAQVGTCNYLNITFKNPTTETWNLATVSVMTGTAVTVPPTIPSNSAATLLTFAGTSTGGPAVRLTYVASSNPNNQFIIDLLQPVCDAAHPNPPLTFEIQSGNAYVNYASKTPASYAAGTPGYIYFRAH